MAKRLIFAIAVVSACCVAVFGFALLHGQSPALSPDQQRALNVLDAITKALPNEGDTPRHLNWLRESVRSRPNLRLPPTSLSALEADLSALIMSSGFPESDRKRVVEVVREDLKLKAEYCRAHPDGMAAHITLRVRTWQQGDKREASQWRVMYINAPLRGFRGAEKFPKLSSPTEVQVPPGVYMIWAQDDTNDARRGPDTIVRPGAAPDQRDLEADLLIPANK
jgi:hypothetical protein